MNPYPNYDDMARLEYGRLLWRNPQCRRQLLNHWTDFRHPYRDRFLEKRQLIEEILGTDESGEAELEKDLRARDLSLRAVMREIPPVFGSFWAESASP